MNHLMIDTETLGTKPGCVILSIGAVAFDPLTGELGNEFYMTVDPSTQFPGASIEPGAVVWWSKQSDAARKAAFAGGPPLTAALWALKGYAAAAKAVWSHGVIADIAWLDAAFLACGMESPWKYWAARDTRTVYDLAGVNVKDFRSEGTEHHALHDAIAQARAVCASYQRLGLQTPVTVPLIGQVAA